jgi:heme-degrading monooxygenase HmoA
MRMWGARATITGAEEYVQHAAKRVFSKLREIEGHRGAYLLRRTVDGAVEFVVLTLWESIDAVRRFAVVDLNKAVVEPEARAFLTSFDDPASHFEVVQCAEE